jgi:hypothetical protein
MCYVENCSNNFTLPSPNFASPLGSSCLQNECFSFGLHKLPGSVQRQNGLLLPPRLALQLVGNFAGIVNLAQRLDDRARIDAHRSCDFIFE